MAVSSHAQANALRLLDMIKDAIIKLEERRGPRYELSEQKFGVSIFDASHSYRGFAKAS